MSGESKKLVVSTKGWFSDFTVQGIFEDRYYGKAFSIFYPGRSVPIWFTSQRNASSITFIASHSKLRYLNTCIVYNFNSGRRPYNLHMIIINRTKDNIIMFRPACYGIPEGEEYMTWISQLKLGIHEVGPGDEVDISIYTDKGATRFKLKEVGVDVVYEGQEEEGVDSAKQEACDKTCQDDIPVEAKPNENYAATPLYLLGSCDVWRIGLDGLVKQTLQ